MWFQLYTHCLPRALFRRGPNGPCPGEKKLQRGAGATSGWQGSQPRNLNEGVWRVGTASVLPVYCPDLPPLGLSTVCLLWRC